MAAKDCTISFVDLINKYLDKYPGIYNSINDEVKTNLGAWRGKASFIMNDVSNITAQYITWGNVTSMQNDWGMTSPEDVMLKKPKEIVDYAKTWFNKTGVIRENWTAAAAPNYEIFAKWALIFPLTPHHVWEY